MGDVIEILADEYNRLIDKAVMLDALFACGVDNWEGWDDAMDIYNGEDN